MYPVLITFLLTAAAPVFLRGQDTLHLRNPSFEDEFPRPGVLPEGWVNRGDSLESPPDIQPGSFSVFAPAAHGHTYLGLVVRDNNTWEGAGQVLQGFMMQDSAYTFELSLCRSKEFTSASRLSGNPTNYLIATILQIWGRNTETGARELLAYTEPVMHNRWERYEFVLKPLKGSYNEIQLFAYYKNNTVKPYCGNLMVDNCSPIVKKNNSF